MTRIALWLLLATSSLDIALAQATFHADAARTGVYTGIGPVREPQTKWTFKAARARAMPATSGSWTAIASGSSRTLQPPTG